MKLDLYQVDAFSAGLFTGNPAAVCPMEKFLDDEILQSIAAENNLSETAFIVPRDGGYEIRWFTPGGEVQLCGHATLASSYVIFNFIEQGSDTLSFQSKGGPLFVKKLEDGLIQLNFPAITIEEIDDLPGLAEALGKKPKLIYQSKQDYLAIYETKDEILSIKPDMDKLMKIGLRAVIISSKSNDDFDFVSRFFVPKLVIPEDPVTGSAHCILAPYWAKILKKDKMRAKQLSKRGGDIACELFQGRVLLSGKAHLFMKGEIFI